MYNVLVYASLVVVLAILPVIVSVIIYACYDLVKPTQPPSGVAEPQELLQLQRRCQALEIKAYSHRQALDRACLIYHLIAHGKDFLYAPTLDTESKFKTPYFISKDYIRFRGPDLVQEYRYKLSDLSSSDVSYYIKTGLMLHAAQATFTNVESEQHTWALRRERFW